MSGRQNADTKQTVPEFDIPRLNGERLPLSFNLDVIRDPKLNYKLNIELRIENAGYIQWLQENFSKEMGSPGKGDSLNAHSHNLPNPNIRFRCVVAYA